MAKREKISTIAKIYEEWDFLVKHRRKTATGRKALPEAIKKRDLYKKRLKKRVAAL